MEYPQGGLIGKSIALYKKIRIMNIPIHAANAGYFIVLSVFPMLILLINALRHTSFDVMDLLDLVSGYLPAALLDEARSFLIHTYAYSGAAVVSVSAVGALWSAGRGIYGILRGLNAIYGVTEHQGWLWKRLISAGYTFAFLIVLVLSLLVNVFGQNLLRQLPQGEFWRILSRIIDFRFLFMMLLQTALFAAMYGVLPNKKSALTENLPGALAASLGWQIFSGLFSWYVEHFGGYHGIYGSVYAIALGMLWLYFCLCLLFLGAALNQLWWDQRRFCSK